MARGISPDLLLKTTVRTIERRASACSLAVSPHQTLMPDPAADMAEGV